MQLLLPLPGQTDDTSLADAAAARSVGIGALSPLHLARSPDRGLLLGFGRLPEHKIPPAVDALWSVLNEAGATPSPGRPRRAPDS
jgi:DNA-binding transcriptional MocR family regulator